MSSLVQGPQYEFTSIHLVIRRHTPQTHTPPSELALWKNVSAKLAALQLVPGEHLCQRRKGSVERAWATASPCFGAQRGIVLGRRWWSPDCTHQRRASAGTVHPPMLCALRANGAGMDAPVPWVQTRLGFQRGSSHELLPLKKDVHVFGGSHVCRVCAAPFGAFCGPSDGVSYCAIT